jgi:hypothetical protein
LPRHVRAVHRDPRGHAGADIPADDLRQYNPARICGDQNDPFFLSEPLSTPRHAPAARKIHHASASAVARRGRRADGLPPNGTLRRAALILRAALRLKDASNRPGTLQMHPVAGGRGDELPVDQQPDHVVCKRQKLRVALTSHDGNGHPQLRQPAPQGRHVPDTNTPQHIGKRLWPVATVVFPRQRSDLGGLAGEQRLGAPALDELLKGHLLEILGERAVGAAPLRPLERVGDARRTGDENQPHHPLRSRKRDVQRYSATQRVAAQDEALRARIQDVPHAARKRDRARRVSRFAVAREVERQRAAAFPVEQFRHAIPRSAGAPKSVQQDDVLAHTTIVSGPPAVRPSVDPEPELVADGDEAVCLKNSCHVAREAIQRTDFALAANAA